jgi:Outer membrane receptor proteins, mostly Fe transport
VHAATQSIEIGNPLLSLERSNNLDVSFSWDKAKTQGYLSVYYNQLSDYIYLQATGQSQDETPIYAYQQTNALFYGIELDATYRVRSGLTWRVWGDYSKGRQDTNDLPRMPPMRLATELSGHYKAWRFDISGTHAWAHRRIAEHETPTDQWTRMDAAVHYSIDHTATGAVLFFRVNNITDAEIRHSVSFLKDSAPEPGRSLEIGIRFLIN